MSLSNVGTSGGGLATRFRVNSDQLDPIFVPLEESDMRGVPESGWYIMNDSHRMVGGPFFTLEDCILAISSASNSSGSADGL